MISLIVNGNHKFSLTQFSEKLKTEVNQAMTRSMEEIKARSALILDDEKVISLVKASNSPSAAYEMVFAETKSIDKAKAGRWLAVLHRDYPNAYSELLQSKLRQVNFDKTQTEKEKKT